MPRACVPVHRLLRSRHPSRPRVGEGLAPRGPGAEADILPAAIKPRCAGSRPARGCRQKAGALAAFSQAVIAEDNADADTALADYQKALSLDPGYTELAVKVAFELARRGDPSAGIQVLKDYIKASPKAPLAYLYLSQLYAKYLGKPELGLKYAQQALDLDPTNLPSYIAVYEIEHAIKRPGKASEVLDRAARLAAPIRNSGSSSATSMLKARRDGPVPSDQLGKIAADFPKSPLSWRQRPMHPRSGCRFLRPHWSG